MFRHTVPALAAAALALAPQAQAEPVVVKAQQARSGLERHYLKLYWGVVRTHGRQAPGRNIVTRGFRTHGRVRPASRAEVARSARTFKRWLAPPVPPVRASDRPPHGQSAAYAGGRWAIPESIVMCESGGDYNVVNGSSGARGAYQLLPSTYYGNGGDGSWSPADQDRVAARVWDGGAGRSQWAC